jgi:hypothetical protein
VGRIRGWTKPVAWLGPALTIFGAVAFSLVFVPSFGAQSRDVQVRYDALPAALAASGLPPVHDMGPVISDHPIWWADALRASALGLPDEPPSSVLALARTFPGTRYLILSSRQGRWPDILKDGGPDAACFQEVPLTLPADGAASQALRDTHVYALVCS